MMPGSKLPGKSLTAIATALLFLFSTTAAAQKIYPWDDHIFPFCTDENPYGITYKSGIIGEAAFPRNTKVGCLNTTPGPVWYYMQIDHPGDLLIYIEQHNLIGQLIDVDFACWGPFQAISKKDFLQKLRHSYRLEVTPQPSHRPENGDHSRDLGAYPYGNMVDCSFAPDGTEWCYIPNAKSGEWYLLLITNYSRKPGKIHFERVNSKSTATTRCDVTIPVNINPIPRDLPQIDDHTSVVCLYDKKALITIELETENDFSLSTKSLKKTKVTVSANGKSYKAQFVEDHFECEIDIERDTTVYQTTINCPDPAFTLQSENYYLVRTRDCLPEQVPLKHGSSIDAGSVDIEQLRRGDTPFTVTLPDNGAYTGILLDDYDVHIRTDFPYIESISARGSLDKLEVTARLRGEWCECFVPDSLHLTLRLTPKESRPDLSPIEAPVSLALEVHAGWLDRCLWVILTLAALLLFMLYLWALLKKNRFHRSARLLNAYFEDDNHRETERRGKLLRRTGFGPWLDRWLNPFGDETSTISFHRPKTKALTFTASRSKNRILLKASCFDARTMIVPNYTPAPDGKPGKKSEPIGLNAGTSMEIKGTSGAGTTRQGHLKFITEGRDNEGGFKLFLGILIALAAVVFAILLIEMLKGLI